MVLLTNLNITYCEFQTLPIFPERVLLESLFINGGQDLKSFLPKLFRMSRNVVIPKLGFSCILSRFQFFGIHCWSRLSVPFLSTNWGLHHQLKSWINQEVLVRCIEGPTIGSHRADSVLCLRPWTNPSILMCPAFRQGWKYPISFFFPHGLFYKLN